MRKNAYAAKQAEYDARFHAIDTEARETIAAMQALAEDDGVPLTCMCDDPSVVSKVERLRAQLPAGRPRVLYVDDDKANRVNLSTYLDVAFDVTLAESADEAISLLERDRFDIVLSDHRMPGMSGDAFLRIVGERWPGVRRLLTSAYLVAFQSPGVEFIPKPWNLLELEAKLAMRAERHA